MRVLRKGNQFTFKEIEDMMAIAGFTEFHRINLGGFSEALIGVKRASKILN